MTVRPDPTTPLRRRDLRTDLGQTAIVAVLAVTLVVGIIGTTLVATVLQSLPLQQSAAVSVYAHRALQAGENAYVTAVNANPSLAQCNTGTNGTGLCGGIDYGKWNEVTGSAGTPGSPTDGFAEWYAFGNPQPTFDPTSHALTNLAVQVVGAAHNPNTSTNYIFDSETMNLAAKNGFLNNVWWSNYESYNASGSYTNCNYNWKLGYNINGGGSGCSPVYFGPNDYLFGPVYTNDSVFVSGNGAVSGSPSFGTSIVTPTVPSAVVTADPNCQFVDATNGMSGSPSNCSAASNDVALYNHLPSDPSPHSSFNNTVQPPPQTDAQLGLIAGQNGCLYSGPTQITLKPNAGGVGQMSVISPDTPERNITVNGSPVTQDANNIATNYNDCPNDGTYTNLPPNGVVFVQNAKAGQTVVGANPFDDYLNNTVTNLAATPSPPTAGNSVLLTATITSASNQIASGATVAFSQTTRSGSTTSSAVIPACSNVSNWTAPVASGSNWTSTVTCPTTESANGTGAFSAAYSGGNSTTASQANLGQTNTLTPSLTYGANSQTNAGGCSACYFGESSNADSEGDAFVNGSVSGQLTIGTDNNVVIDGNITYADCSGQWVTGQSGEANSFCPYQVGGINDSLGLIANEYVEINHPVASPGGPVLAACGSVTGVLCDPSNSGSGLTIDAAILALTQSFTVNNFGVANTNYNVTIGGTPYTGNTEGPLAVYGSIQQFARGPIGTFCGFNPARPTNACSSFSASGYVKHYTWNPLLDLASPPSYLTPSTAPWSLTSVNSNGGTHSTAVCPALTGIYAGPPPATPAPFNDYCSKADGGLPGYPASTAPAPPTNVSATASIGGTATVTWTDPPPTVSPITNYTVSSIPPCTTCSGLTVVGATATSATVTGLVPGTAYVFVVSATNALGTSDVSSPSPSVTVPSVPYAPTLVSAVGNVNDTVTVTWTDPSSVGSPISQYTITPSPACPGCTGLVVPGATATSTTISGLTVGGSYSFTVSATNGLGVGPASMPSNTVVVPTSPGPPLAVSGTSFANTQSVVSWSAPASTGGLPITGYAVTSSPGNKTCTTAGIPSCTVNGLTNGTAYTFKVTATNAIGTGPASAPSGPATPSTLPGAPVIGTATNGVDSATVSFGAPASNGGAPITGYTVTSSPGGVTATCASSPCTVSGLTAGTTYTFKVTATNGSGTGPSSGSSNAITATGQPAAPTGVSATSYANGQSVVSWTAPYNGGSPITSYTVTSSGGQTCTTATTSCTVPGLTNGTTYTFTVTATNVLGTGAPSAAATATPGTVPGAPIIGTATGGYHSATVTWSAPLSNGGLPVTGYTVTSSPAVSTPAACSTALTGSSTSCIFTGLTNGTSYTFTVKATNAAGTGPASSPSNLTAPANTVPDAPSNVNATSYANTQSVVSWTAAAANGSAITAYTVTSSPGGRTCTTAGTSCTVSGLTNGTAYTFTVTATNGIGVGPASAPSSPATPSTVPGAPTSVTATSYANAQSSVSWTAPVSNGGAAITTYTVTSSPSGRTCTTSTTSCTVATLTNGTSYTFTVTATNGSGTGPASAASPAAVPATVPGPPTAVAGTSNADSQSVVTWSAPASTGGAAITSYTVTATGGQTCTTPNGSIRTCTVTGLTNGTSYLFTVTATNAAGTGSPSAPSGPATPATRPGAPTAVTAQGSLDSQSIVTWTPPASNGGLAITGYTVTANSGQTCATPDGVTTTCTVLGLTNGTIYTFTVTATNALGTGPASAASNPVIPAATPGAPTGVTASSFADSLSVVAWTAPASTGGSPITSYTVTANSGQTCVTANGSTTSCTLLGLTNGTTYTFTVVATNSIGDGPPSAPVTATPSTVPTAPTGVTATSYANSKSVVSWTAPASNGGAAITGYTVTSAPGAFTCTTASTTCTVNGLTNGTAYTFTVTATNGSGNSPASVPSAPATPATLPGAPTAVTASSFANTQSVVSWTAPSNPPPTAVPPSPTTP
jgi:fibronectin type 3 domain-containing protein